MPTPLPVAPASAGRRKWLWGGLAGGMLGLIFAVVLLLSVLNQQPGVPGTPTVIEGEIGTLADITPTERTIALARQAMGEDGFLELTIGRHDQYLRRGRSRVAAAGGGSGGGRSIDPAPLYAPARSPTGSGTTQTR